MRVHKYTEHASQSNPFLKRYYFFRHQIIICWCDSGMEKEHILYLSTRNAHTHIFLLKHTRNTHPHVVMKFCVHSRWWHGAPLAWRKLYIEFMPFIFIFVFHFILFVSSWRFHCWTPHKLKERENRRNENSVEIKSGSNQCINNDNIYIPNQPTSQHSQYAK